MNQEKYNICVKALNTELVPALGCTEPIAIAYASAKARSVLGCMPEKMVIRCSGNIIKNVKGVIVPTTGDMRGVETSGIVGVLGGNSEKTLEVLSEVKPEHIEQTKKLIEEDFCEVILEKGVSNLYLKVIVTSGEEEATVEIIDTHTNITQITKNQEVIFDAHYDMSSTDSQLKSLLTIEDLYDFANEVKLEDVEEIIKKQIQYNMTIAEEGMKNDYGANVGKTLIKSYGKDNIDNIAKAYAAAGSDARMAGCVLPVIINSGSGNQGMTVSIPVVIYAKALKVSDEKLLRALVFSNLIALYQKSGIGKLSAYCGAVSAACGSGAGIAYMNDESFDVIKTTIKNALGNVSGIVCDGAKSSCAAKIASSVDAALLGYHMATDGQGFSAGEGLIMEDIDKTISNICNLAKEGMKETDIEILQMMISSK